MNVFIYFSSMLLAKHISDLLYRYECVIVPGFGGFVARKLSSTIQNQQFTAPTKQISFNVNLHQNDGLLVNHIAQSMQISYKEALFIVNNTVETWHRDLEQNSLLLLNIGQFEKVEGHLVFIPQNQNNYLTSSFGLTDVNAHHILRHTVETTPEVQKIIKKKPFYKPLIAASVAACLALMFGGYTYVNHLKDKLHHQAIAQQDQTIQKIQQASFQISTPLPTLTLNVEKEVFTEENEIQDIVDRYHIIAGAFKSEENALKKVDLLMAKGYDAKIMGVNKWGLIQVSYLSLNNKLEAIKMLKQIKRQDNKHAWLLVDE